MINKVTLFAAFLVACVISGCSSGPGKKKDVSQKNEVTIHELSDPDMLNPVNATSSTSNYMTQNIVQQLTFVDYKTMQRVPVLADSLARVEKTADGKLRFTYRIRPEAKWDNGSQVTANDVEFSLKVIMNPQVNDPQVKSYFESFTDFEHDQTDPLKFTIVCGKVYFLAKEFSGDFPILPEYVYDPTGLMKGFTYKQLMTEGEKLKDDPKINEFAKEFNSEKFSRDTAFIKGSGPYQFAEWTTGKQIVLVKKKNWWGDKLASSNLFFEANLDKIVYKIVPDQTSAIVALKAGNLDVMYGIKPKDFSELPNSEVFQKNFNAFTPVSFQYSYIGLNTRAPKLSDKKTRQAIAHLIDVDKIIKTVIYGKAQKVIGPVHPGKTKYYNNDIVAYNYDLEVAKKLLAEAGWKDSNNDGILDKTIKGEHVELNLDYTYNEGNDTRKQIGLMIQEEARKVGIKINVNALEYSVMLEKFKKHDFEMSYGAWIGSPQKDDFKQLFHTESALDGGHNFENFGTPTSDALIDSIRVQLDDDKLVGMYKRFQVMMHDEAAELFMFASTEKIVIHKRFTNAEPSAIRPGFYAPAFKLSEN